jgi:hypothetical protein
MSDNELDTKLDELISNLLEIKLIFEYFGTMLDGCLVQWLKLICSLIKLLLQILSELFSVFYD